MASHIGRREFLATLGGAAAAPLAARAQQPAMPVVGYLGPGSSEPVDNRIAALLRGLKQTGYIEGNNVGIEYRWAEGRYDRLRALADDLLSRRVAVITAGGTPAVVAVKAATTTIPIVFAMNGDPMKLGLVASFARPGGNATGIRFFIIALAKKRLGLLHELVPKGSVIGLLVNPSNPNAESDTKDAESAAQELGHGLIVVEASTASDIDAAFATLAQRRVGGLVIAGDAFFFVRRVHLTTLASRHGIPAIHPDRDFTLVGGLMSYASNIADAYREMGVYVGRILKGAKPADLPVMQPTKLEFVINLTTAKTLGLTVPDKLLALADEVIE
jgi:ABC-type uncharacterized transport system substrate-binding protein